MKSGQERLELLRETARAQGDTAEGRRAALGAAAIETADGWLRIIQEELAYLRKASKVSVLALAEGLGYSQSTLDRAMKRRLMRLDQLITVLWCHTLTPRQFLEILFSPALSPELREQLLLAAAQRGFERRSQISAAPIEHLKEITKRVNHDIGEFARQSGVVGTSVPVTLAWRSVPSALFSQITSGGRTLYVRQMLEVIALTGKNPADFAAMAFPGEMSVMDLVGAQKRGAEETTG